jgi:hypothetical protein
MNYSEIALVIVDVTIITAMMVTIAVGLSYLVCRKEINISNKSLKEQE